MSEELGKINWVSTKGSINIDNTQFDPSKGAKFDDNKPRMDLLDADFLEGVANVLTFGANKYAPHNWRNGINTSRLIAATYRHLGAINKGEDIDSESGLPHVYHASCCLMFLANMLKTRPDLDDRWRPEKVGQWVRAKL